MKINGVELKDLLKKGSELKSHEDEFEFLQKSYLGGKEYRDGEYLVQHKRELKSSFKKRLKNAVYTNYVSPIIDIYNSYLHREGIKRDSEGLNKSLFDAYIKDADLDGTSHAKVMREVSLAASLFGIVGILVDNSAQATGVLGADLKSKIHTYVKLYTPGNIINIIYDFSTGRPVLDIVVLQEDFDDSKNDYFIVYTQTEFFRIKRKGRMQPEVISQGEHSLGYVPFIAHKNKAGILEEMGMSDVIDIAELNRRVYQLDSTALEIMENTAFPFLEVPHKTDIGGESDDIVIGTTNVLEFDPDAQDGRHKWVEPAGTSLAEILKWRNQSLEDIRYHSKIGGSDATKSKSAVAGVSLELMFQQLNAILAEKAENMENTENNIFSIIGDYNSMSYTGNVEYPRRFGVRDLSFEIDQILKVDTLVDSKEFKRAAGIKVVKRVLGDSEENSSEIKAIENELYNKKDSTQLKSVDAGTLNA